MSREGRHDPNTLRSTIDPRPKPAQTPAQNHRRFNNSPAACALAGQLRANHSGRTHVRLIADSLPIADSRNRPNVHKSLRHNGLEKRQYAHKWSAPPETNLRRAQVHFRTNARKSL